MFYITLSLLMDPFLDAFFAVDLDNDEIISLNDLKNYVDKYNLDEKMIEKWKELFDPNNTGTISLATFCDVLGLKMEEARKIRIELEKRTVNQLPSDINVISHQMNINDQIQICNEVQRLLLFSSNQLNDKEIAHKLKLWLQKTYNSIWHVIVLRGVYGISYTHLENRSLQFCLKDKCFIMWATPDKLELI
uniref:SJCHGC09029 protein n=1 Tax=Schistosoma japonicum TaxID=6182 RepID=Q5DDI1_SCHJA|nr:SJCHGC09029 protein [Schistosoma japonicum]